MKASEVLKRIEEKENLKTNKRALKTVKEKQETPNHLKKKRVWNYIPESTEEEANPITKVHKKQPFVNINKSVNKPKALSTTGEEKNWEYELKHLKGLGKKIFLYFYDKIKEKAVSENNSGIYCQQEVATELNMDKNTFKVTLQRLKNNGFILKGSYSMGPKGHSSCSIKDDVIEIAKLLDQKGLLRKNSSEEIEKIKIQKEEKRLQEKLGAIKRKKELCFELWLEKTPINDLKEIIESTKDNAMIELYKTDQDNEKIKKVLFKNFEETIWQQEKVLL